MRTGPYRRKGPLVVLTSLVFPNAVVCSTQLRKNLSVGWSAGGAGSEALPPSSGLEREFSYLGVAV